MISVSDNSLLDPDRTALCRWIAYEFGRATSRGRFDASLQKGSLAVISGRIAKQSPDAMKVRTPTSILGVRGTEIRSERE